MARIFNRIPGEFEHKQNADQTQDDFCGVVLNDEGQPRQCNDRPGSITHQGTKLDEQGRDESTRCATANGFGSHNSGRGTECDG
jgi:hypothetical protein